MSAETHVAKSCPAPHAFALRKSASALLTHPSGAKRFAPPLGARIRASLASSEVRIPAILTDSIQRQAGFTRQQAASNALAAELATAVQGAESLAQEAQWTQRKLAAKLGLCPRTWRRIRSLEVNPADWLPKIHSTIYEQRRQCPGNPH